MGSRNLPKLKCREEAEFLRVSRKAVAIFDSMNPPHDGKFGDLDFGTLS